jgi:hypothetical protein
MKNRDDFVVVEPIIEKMLQKIAEHKSISPLDAMEQFYHSKTYEMLITPELYLWDFSDKAIFDMWLSEQKTGNPRDSVYISEGKEYE